MNLNCQRSFVRSTFRAIVGKYFLLQYIISSNVAEYFITNRLYMIRLSEQGCKETKWYCLINSYQRDKHIILIYDKYKHRANILNTERMLIAVPYGHNVHSHKLSVYLICIRISRFI